ncbi:MAG: hypothetical protein AAF567_05445 [Actinomycetota bacterium]
MQQPGATAGLAPSTLEEARTYRAQGGYRAELVDYLRRCGSDPAEAEYLADRFDLELGLAGAPRPHDINPTVAKQLDAHWELTAASATVPQPLAPEESASKTSPARSVPSALEIARAALERAHEATAPSADSSAGMETVQTIAQMETSADADPAIQSIDQTAATASMFEQDRSDTAAGPQPAIVETLADTQNELQHQALRLIDETQTELAGQARAVLDQAQHDLIDQARTVIEETRSELEGQARDVVENSPLTRTTSLASALATRGDGAAANDAPASATPTAKSETRHVSTPTYASRPDKSNSGPQHDEDWQDPTEFGYRLAKPSEDEDPNVAINEARSMAREGKTREDIVEHLVTVGVTPDEAAYVAAETGARQRPDPDAKPPRRRGLGRAIALILMMLIAGGITMYLGWSAYSESTEWTRSPLSLLAIGGALVLNGLRAMLSLRKSGRGKREDD